MNKKYSYVACSRKSKTCSCPTLTALANEQDIIEAYEIEDDYGNVVEFSLDEMDWISTPLAHPQGDSDPMVELRGENGSVQMQESEYRLIISRLAEDGFTH